MKHGKPKSGSIATLVHIICVLFWFLLAFTPLNPLLYFLSFCGGYLYLGQHKKAGAAALLAFLLLIPSIFVPLYFIMFIVQLVVIFVISLDSRYIGSRMKSGVIVSEGECGIMAKIFKGSLWVGVIGEQVFDSRNKETLPEAYKIKNPMV